jgi:hypothetical protein
VETAGERTCDIRLWECVSAEARDWAATRVPYGSHVAPPSAALEIDHVVIATGDLDAAARALEAEHGLVSIAGGRHPNWGTANRIVPLGDAYLELVAVVDEATAAASAFGRWVAGASAGILRPLGWAVRTNELDGTTQRLGVPASPGSRSREDGQTLRWRLAGIERAAEEPALPSSSGDRGRRCQATVASRIVAAKLSSYDSSSTAMRNALRPGRLAPPPHRRQARRSGADAHCPLGRGWRDRHRRLTCASIARYVGGPTTSVTRCACSS